MGMALMIAILTTLTVVSLGRVFRHSLCPALSNDGSHPLLEMSLSWFLGYFLLEGLLGMLAAAGLFNRPAILATALAALAGSLVLSARSPVALNDFRTLLREERLSIAGLAAVSAFVLFWNLYPPFDVDSFSSYFEEIRAMFEAGGFAFDPRTDVRQNLPLGENLLYSIGWAIWPDSNLYSQLMHGLSKVFVLFAVYGGARALGLGGWSLIAPALVASEEHFVASGANLYVRINSQLVLAVFLMAFGLFQLLALRKASYAWLAGAAAFVAMGCKYYGVVFPPICLGLIMIAVFRRAVSLSGLTRANWLGLVLLALFGGIPYFRNLLLTGTPLFPIALGPFVPWGYDADARAIGHLWHYHLGLGAAFKSISAFMVWPGILSVKILLPLLVLTGALHGLRAKMPSSLALRGLAFAIATVFLVLYQQSFAVYEMRYYRFALAVAAVASAALIGSVIDQLLGLAEDFARKPLRAFWQRLACAVTIVAVMVYSARYSFDVMGGSRPSAKEIVSFVSGKVTERQILERYFTEPFALYAELKAHGANTDELGYLVSMNWPTSLLPIKGTNIGLFQSGAVETAAFFDEGAFAYELLRLGLKRVFIERDTIEGYPLGSKAVQSVLKECGKQASAKAKILELVWPCLQRKATHANLSAGKQKLQATLDALAKRPKYEPFVTPPYSGIGGL